MMCARLTNTRVYVQMATIVNFTRMIPMSMPKDVLDEFCNPMKNIPKDSLELMEFCYPQVMKKVKEICSRSTDGGKDGKGDGYGKGAGRERQKSIVYT